jgi:hypothetical protein
MNVPSAFYRDLLLNLTPVVAFNNRFFCIQTIFRVSNRLLGLLVKEV